MRRAAKLGGRGMTYCPLDLVESYLRRFVSYPSEHALVAHVLWIAHCHMFERFDTTPRLAFMSAEKESGKSRALEVTALFVPEPVLSISASPAVIVRLISEADARFSMTRSTAYSATPRLKKPTPTCGQC